MQQSVDIYASGYHSDSVLQQRTPTRRRPLTELLHQHSDSLGGQREPLLEHEPDSDREGPPPRSGGMRQDRGSYDYDEAHHRSLPGFYPDLIRVLPEDPFIPTPRKARWNKKVTRKRSIRPLTTIRKGRLAAYCISSELQTEKLHRLLLQLKKDRSMLLGRGGLTGANQEAQEWEGWSPEWQDKMYMGVVYSTNDDGKAPDRLDGKHIFSFPYGCVVFWGCNKEEEEHFIEAIREFAVEPVSKLEMEESYDDLTFLYGEHSRIYNYEITLSTNDPEEKLALSFSLAQSAKIFVFEDRLDVTISSTKHIPLSLAEKGHIDIGRTAISKLTGKVFIERNEVNLHSDILDTPEFFWEADVWEPLYKRFCNYLDIPNRIEILNKRMDIMKELLDVLNTQLSDNHASKLEWIVIILIVVEVIIQLAEILLRDVLHVFDE